MKAEIIEQEEFYIVGISVVPITKTANRKEI